MKCKLCLALVCSLSLVPALGATQPTTMPSASRPSDAAIKKRITARGAKPVEQHKVLEALVGAFDEHTTLHLGGRTLEAHSTGEGKWILDGAFVQYESAAAPDEDMKGSRMVIWGYDPAAGKYTYSGYETGALTSVTATGDYDAASKTFTYAGTIEYPGAGSFPFKLTVTVGGNGDLTQVISIQSPGQTDFKEVATTIRTRAK